jgi:hypothetical protein
MDESIKAFTRRIRRYLAAIEAGISELDSASADAQSLNRIKLAARQAYREVHDFLAENSTPQKGGMAERRPRSTDSPEPRRARKRA